MDKITEIRFCLPCDLDCGKNSLTVMPEFQLVQGNLANVPERHSTGWRTMPCHLCTMEIVRKA